MKLKKLWVLTLLTTILFACKNENTPKQIENSDSSDVEQVIDENIFTVTLNTTVQKDDSFQIYFKDVEDAPFVEDNSFL